MYYKLESYLDLMPQTHLETHIQLCSFAPCKACQKQGSMCKRIHNIYQASPTKYLYFFM